MKIRAQLTLSLSGIITLSFLMALLSVAWVLRQKVLQQLQEEQQAQARMLAAVSGQALTLKDELFMLNYVRLLKEMPGVSYAFYVDGAGKILVHTDPSFVYQPLSKWAESPLSAGGVEWKESVRAGPVLEGEARIGFSREHTQAVLERAWIDILYPIALVALAGLALSLLLGFVLASYMSRSIRVLAKASEEIGRGNLSAEAPVTSSNELGELARMFNSMTEQLRRLDELKAEFIELVSHDLRSPLAAIIAYSEHMTSGAIGELNEKQAKAVDVIQRQCRLLTNMVNNILDMGKIQSGKMEFVTEPFKPGDVLESVYTLYQVVAKGRGLAFSIALSPQVPEAGGDVEKIQQVVTNLVSNAFKFTQKGGSVTIGARELPRESMIQFFVQDTGAGIPPEEMPRMFERFHQINQQAQRSQKIRGTGLGLSICKAVVDGLGGRIWVESKLGQGSTFAFTLPRAHGGGGPSNPPRQAAQ